MRPHPPDPDRRLHLAQDYGRFCQARMALGSAWAGLIALWPFLDLMTWSPRPAHGLRSRVVMLLAVCGPALWIGGRTLLSRWLYQPFGKAILAPGPRDRVWNNRVVGLTLLVGVMLFVATWRFYTRLGVLGAPKGPAFVAWEVALQLWWVAQVVWMGWRCLLGWEDRVIFSWLTLLGLQELTKGSPWSVLIDMPLMGGCLVLLVLGAWWLVRGARDHRRFRAVVEGIRGLPGSEA